MRFTKRKGERSGLMRCSYSGLIGYTRPPPPPRFIRQGLLSTARVSWSFLPPLSPSSNRKCVSVNGRRTKAALALTANCYKHTPSIIFRRHPHSTVAVFPAPRTHVKGMSALLFVFLCVFVIQYFQISQS